MARAIWAVVVAAGEGRRFGTMKQFETLAGRSVLEWSLGAARSVAAGIVLVLPSGEVGDPAFAGLAEVVTTGGATRSESVRNGLAAVPATAEVVVVHDAARPLASPALFGAVVAALVDGVDGAVPGLAVADTVKRHRQGRIVETLDRSELVVVQTPQAFRAAALRRAHGGEGQATDDAALVEAAGGVVVIVAGEASNFKLTLPEDLERAEEALRVRAAR